MPNYWQLSAEQKLKLDKVVNDLPSGTYVVKVETTDAMGPFSMSTSRAWVCVPTRPGESCLYLKLWFKHRVDRWVKDTWSTKPPKGLVEPKVRKESA